VSKRFQTTIALTGLQARGAQVWRSVRLVPLVRERPLQKIRLAGVDLDERLTATTVDVHPSHRAREIHFVSVVPHAYVLSWGEDCDAELSLGGSFVREESHVPRTKNVVRAQLRMVRRASERSVRFVPQQLALEGLLSLHFGGPTLASRDWSERVLREGLSPRTEMAVSGRRMPHLADALRTFEILEQQCGMLLFYKDMLIGSFVAPRPEDYRALHESLLLDLFPGELLEYANYDAPRFTATIDPARTPTLEALRNELHAEEIRWAEFYEAVSNDLLREANAEPVYSMEGYSLERFVTELRRKGEHHAGERVVTRDGTVAYLKTYRLSSHQSRRAYLLDRLAKNGWILSEAATATRLTLQQLVEELQRVGMGWMVGEGVLHELKVRR
jgi:hypothetical protein